MYVKKIFLEICFTYVCVCVICKLICNNTRVLTASRHACNIYTWTLHVGSNYTVWHNTTLLTKHAQIFRRDWRWEKLNIKNIFTAKLKYTLTQNWQIYSTVFCWYLLKVNSTSGISINSIHRQHYWNRRDLIKKDKCLH